MRFHTAEWQTLTNTHAFLSITRFVFPPIAVCISSFACHNWPFHLTPPSYLCFILHLTMSSGNRRAQKGGTVADKLVSYGKSEWALYSTVFPQPRLLFWSLRDTQGHLQSEKREQHTQQLKPWTANLMTGKWWLDLWWQTILQICTGHKKITIFFCAFASKSV